MKNLFLTLIAIFISASVFSQSRFVVQNVTTQVYNNIDDAFENAVYGDTIYLPGGVFALSSEQQTQNKKLTIIGAGYNTDSTLATSPTYISHGMTFKGNSDGTYITGIQFNGTIYLGDATDDAMDVKIERCYVSSIVLRAVYTDTVDTNFEMNECVVYYIYGNNAKNALIQNCIIHNQVTNFNQSVFSHNIFTNIATNYYSDYYLFKYIDECMIADNIFWNTTNSNICLNMENTVFTHNMFFSTLAFPIRTNTANNNLFGVTHDIMFTDVPSATTFTFDNNYHLITGSPGIGAASDGTDIGIYGGTKVWKDGGLPFNPHIRSTSIPMQTTDATLPVEISVGSQNN